MIGTLYLHLQRVLHHHAVVTLDGETEGMVDRGLDDDLVARIGKHVDGHADALDDAGDVGDPLTLYLPTVVAFDPTGHGVPIVLGVEGVAIDRIGHALLESVDHETWSLEVHVSHPEWQ